MLFWGGCSLSIVVLLVVARKRLALGMAVAALILGAFTLPPATLGRTLWSAVSDPSVLLLALIVGIIPWIGGVMEASGQMERLVTNLRIGVRPFLALSPALLGLLPMPGGALLSAPLVERGAGHVAPDVKAAANVWFRHALLLVYPLGPALIASAKIAGIEVYATIPFLLPAFALTLAAGYVFLLRRAGGRRTQTGVFSFGGLAVPLCILLTAPILDLTLRGLISFSIAELSTLIGVVASLALAASVGRLRPARLGRIFVSTRPWAYALIIPAMFSFLRVFEASGAPEKIAALELSPAVLLVLVGFLLGAATGRIQAPMAILLPVYASGHGAVSGGAFALGYFAVFLGYLVTPIHPCIAVTLSYFRVGMFPFLQRLAMPTALGWGAAWIAALLLFR